MRLAVYLQHSQRGEAARLARALRVPASHISEYANGKRSVPARLAPALERETTFRVLREEMPLCDDWRDLWPDLIPLRRTESESAVAA